MKYKEEVQIKVDEEEGFYKLKSISKHDIEYLFHKKYKKFLMWDLFGKKSYWLLKVDKGEGTEHFFLVKIISEYIKEEYAFQVWNYKTVKPDIIFELKNRKIAIEIETGKNLKHSKKQFLEKIRWLDEDFGDNWFFVVTNRDLVKKYKKYGPTYTRKNVRRAIEKYVEKTNRKTMQNSYDLC